VFPGKLNGSRLTHNIHSKRFFEGNGLSLRKKSKTRAFDEPSVLRPSPPFCSPSPESSDSRLRCVSISLYSFVRIADLSAVEDGTASDLESGLASPSGLGIRFWLILPVLFDMFLMLLCWIRYEQSHHHRSTSYPSYICPSHNGVKLPKLG
jgi:hypothetical protein